MINFVLRRLMSAVPTVFVVITISFFLMRFAPGGPFDLERPLPPDIMANLMKTYQLDQPIWQQYITYLGNALRGDFGPSFIYKDNTVAQLIAQALPYSVQLGATALLIALIGGVILGTIAALRQNGLIDFVVMTFATVGVTIPNFVMGPVLTLIFALMLSLLPAGGWGDGSPYYLALPITVLALPQIAIIARLTRGSMIEALHTDHIRTARAYGLPSRTIVITHALRGAMLPVVSYLAPAAAALLTGSAVVESIFTIPGVGRFFVIGALNRDYPLVMATVVLVAVFVIVFNLIVDIAYGLLDPRVRHD
ncbi:oligopeptide ABC transporter permease OppB [Agrobacterium vitis]|uniref:ABC transporter membrane spanning protein (Oligopeptide) n=2 Tax=Rhizobium/Agrobacterium group TaxID=227290 RepID=B9JUK7_ALLAM|nr:MULTISPECIES: oligopeptide ABC transporter permease OppB [Rhizobium/Agrobacterium group]ACM36002.1 ABC transporter membrane spanning protein (oligopeptide) [Allorhizobium ampelinum S4]MBF2716676.1 oligopeptide ABC transporter permease OppB [Agrobacterium vitis]MCF1448199.1 oligopeptide ABC transporter permease OppB [Allorhizobium ampelinum]MCF1459995.1 oligopeptide ABC transporter permease OppB [Allorhizobium ampelinum]MCF1492125.1 oligopeptide ABC transporter permease OppB [Allorhizobium a